MVENTGDIKCQDLIKTLYSNSFLEVCPKYVSRRETFANLKLITTALIILKRNLLSIEMIRHGL